MMKQYSTATMIDEMVEAIYGNKASSRQKHLYQESLRALARLAKAEQLREMRRDLRKVSNETLPDMHHYGETK